MLSTQDKDVIVEAVQDVEARTGGEIVVSVVPKSEDYSVAAWRAVVFVFLVVVAVILIVRATTSDWVPVFLGEDLYLILIAVTAGLIVGSVTSHVPMLQRTFVLEREFSKAVSRAASEAFISEEIFATTHRNGILIFVSELERMFEVIADSGIGSQVDSDEWVSIVDLMIQKRNAAGLVDAIVSGVLACGDLLEKQSPSAGTDSNELGDQVREQNP
ncbi:MAG: hypothetical protein HKN43_17355 [Rhodothermales bacterium]|nr:hypothetical protein [Rhodothermales bacterium]